MKKNLYTLTLLIWSQLLSLSLGNSFGYLRVTDASFCMDECSEYFLEEESGSFTEFVTNQNNIDLSLYIDRYVEIVSGGEHECVECNAMIINSIQISDDCDYPVACFANPCEVAAECELNTPVDCIANYCGGCNADFYDMDENLVDCYGNPPEEDCVDLSGILFGVCDMYLGVGYADGICQGISGCGWIVDGVDYSDSFFNSYDDCESECLDDNLTCNEISDQYEDIHSGIYASCDSDSDCVSIWGDCDVGLGGCHYSVNSELFNYQESDELVSNWLSQDCMEWVCDCMPLPNSICSQGECHLTYCDGPNPAGCFENGCGDGENCIDFGNSEFGEFCVASACSCDESYIYQSYWACTEDCNGGTCVPEDPQPGDLCVVEETATGGIPGFVECDGQCVDYMYYQWVGDGWCDGDSWGINLNCEALDCDGGDCPDSWCGCTAGDTNDDGTTDIIDIVLIINCILDGDNSCPCSDVNYDGQINILDIIMIVDMIITP